MVVCENGVYSRRVTFCSSIVATLADCSWLASPHATQSGQQLFEYLGLRVCKKDDFSPSAPLCIEGSYYYRSSWRAKPHTNIHTYTHTHTLCVYVWVVCPISTCVCIFNSANDTVKACRTAALQYWGFLKLCWQGCLGCLLRPSI